MKTKLIALTMLLLSGCAATNPTTPMNVAGGVTSQGSEKKSADIAKLSYDLGLLYFENLRDGKLKLDRKAYEQGLTDGLAGKLSTVSRTTNEGQKAWQALADLSGEQLKNANLTAGQIFLEMNKNRKGIITLPSGLQYEVIKEGKSPHKPALNDTVGIIYKIEGIDGSVKIDNLSPKTKKLYEIPLSKIISKGWQEALQLMTLESKWRLYIPGEIAFGEKGLGEKGIMPNEALIIDCLLLDIKINQ
ncbi:MAG: FKBP-type peptidyl-prolyl cis-trans isomerase [Methylococcaceae bacterium]|nr:FKBP-type peptidyl-prolyl cis-trans isomerase [Methylococcaceae bacterium]